MTYEPPSGVPPQGVPPEGVPPYRAPENTQPAYTPPPTQNPPPYTPPPAYTPPAQGYGAPHTGAPHPGGPAGGRSAKALGGFDASTVSPFDWAIMGVGFLAFVFSFFSSYYTVHFKGTGFGSYGGSESAWHGFFGWFAAFVALLSAALVAVEHFAPQLKLPFPVRLVSLGGFVLAFLSALLALVVFPESVPSGLGISTGRGFAYWVDLILIIAGAVLSFLQLKATGGSLPWEKKAASSTVAGQYPSPSAQYPPQAAPSEYPPPAGGQYSPPAAPGQYPPAEQ